MIALPNDQNPNWQNLGHYINPQKGRFDCMWITLASLISGSARRRVGMQELFFAINKWGGGWANVHDGYLGALGDFNTAMQTYRAAASSFGDATLRAVGDGKCPAKVSLQDFKAAQVGPRLEERNGYYVKRTMGVAIKDDNGTSHMLCCDYTPGNKKQPFHFCDY